MIAGLAGTVAELGPDHAVIDVHGVFYLALASSRTLGTLAMGAPARLLVETQVREESITLFGFLDAEERHWFRLLTGVQGVGGRLALAILSALAPADLALAIGREDKAMIARAPGVGPRLAARIATELKGKAPEGLGSAAGSAALPAAGPAREAAAALEALGFRPAEAA
ncbi:MAG: Holliday junction branch migration protein RuvA, partial [Thermaurantiacus sp.]